MKSTLPVFTEVLTSDLKSLVFWACVGIAKSNSGSYRKDIEHIIDSYAEYARLKLPYKAEFGSFEKWLKKLKAKAKA